MNKKSVLAALHAELESQFHRLAGAADESRSYATDPDSKAENKYDTRTVEASYLAAGQAAKVEDLAATLRFFTSWSPPDFPSGSPADFGSLVEVAIPGQKNGTFLLAPRGGGLEAECGGNTITVVTTEARLFQQLCGRRVGEPLADSGMVMVSII